MSIVTIKDRDDDNQNKVDSTGHVYVTDGGQPIAVTGTISATNPSVGPTGTTAPTEATEVGGVDPSGNLQALKVDSTGALEVSGTLTVGTGFSMLSPGYPTQVSVGTTSVLLLPANPNRRYSHFFNNTQQPIFIQYEVSAALNQGIKINPGTFFTLENENLWLGDVNAIGYIAGQLIDVLEAI